YPAGRLVDAPLPTWTHESLLLDRDGQDATTRGGCTVSVHPLLGSHVVLPEEPERHVWQGEVGTEAQPWLGDHQVHEVAVLPGAAYCEMALAAARTVLGDTAEVRDIVFEQMLMLDETTPISATASALAPGILDFAVETYEAGERIRRAHAVLHAEVATDEAAHDIDTLLTAHADGVDGADLRAAFGALGIHHGPAFSGLATAYTADGPAHTVLAVVALPGPLRAHQGAYGVHPALLDACFQSVLAHPVAQNAAVGGMLLPLGVRRLRVNGSARNAHYCYSRIVKADAEGIEADLDILDERGAILLSLEGLRLGTGASQKAQADRVLNERLLSIEWHQRELPEADSVDAGSWLLIKTSGNGDILTAALGDALKAAGAECSTMAWPQHADHQSNTELLMSYVGEQVLTGVVVVPDLADGDAGAHASVRGGDHVRHLVRIIRELPEAPGEPPRLYVVTRNAQSVVADDVPNLEHAGLRGFIRAIGMEHPRLRASQIDIDEATGVEQLARQLLTGSDEDETAWRDGQWYTARLSPAPLRADERYTATASNQHDGMRLQIRTPGDLESLEMVSSERVPPGPGQIEVAVSASSINFVDVLVAFGRCPSFDGRLPELGSEFGGVVTAVGPGVTTHQVGDRVGGVSANGCWGNYVICEANLATKLPDGLEEHHAAAVGLAYGTVWLGLQELARISSTDKVLIHSATGGVGQAAIAVARAAG
ncbi:polyketide synthase dehydratase domain-containing protein, partial [Mycolicibacterium elephantis]